MQITDRQIAVFGLMIATAALFYGLAANKQNKEILAHTKQIKNNIGV